MFFMPLVMMHLAEVISLSYCWEALSLPLWGTMQKENIGYLAVSLGFYKTLFSAPGSSTSSEIPEEEQAAMGLSDGLIRFSIGLDNDIERTYQEIKKCMIKVGVLETDM
jgi:methionine-gamma-lyase